MKPRTDEILAECMQRYPMLAYLTETIVTITEAVVQCYKRGGTVLVCGNGGSAADAEHIVGELMKEFRIRRPVPDADRHALHLTNWEHAEALANSLQQALPAIALSSHTALVSAWCNDVDARYVYAQQVYGYGRPGDVLIALSTSGNSINVVNAVVVARARKLLSIGFTGARPCKLSELCDITVAAPSEMTHVIQEMHLPLYHALCAMVESEMFG